MLHDIPAEKRCIMQQSTLYFTRNALEYILVFLFEYMLRGVASVDHVDIDLYDNACRTGNTSTLIISVDLASSPLSGDEAVRGLSDRR